MAVVVVMVAAAVVATAVVVADPQYELHAGEELQFQC
jgi:hypothetical protein